jgi:hypothetical protein
MKFPSIIHLSEQIKQAVIRFPLAALSAVVGTVLSIYLIEIGDVVDDIAIFNIVLVSALGLTTFISVQLFNERNKYPKWLAYILAILFLGVMFFSLPSPDYLFNTSVPYIRYGVFNAIAHLLVAVVPYLGKGQINGFWHYNKTLFLRIVTTLFYSGVIYIGIALALGALVTLFNVEIEGETFAEVFVIIVGVFNTLFFLAGIPTNFEELEKSQSYPKGLKVFTQFILLPLLALYLVILYAYGSKIIILSDWPKGIVSYMVSAVSVLGILALLLIHPLISKGENAWIRIISKYYYFILLPLVALLFIAVGMRVEEYGITINRYLIILLGIWLSIVCVYFIAKGSSIKFIPVSLVIILLIMSFGPWGVFSVSEKSQLNRLEVILSNSGILIDGKINKEMDWPKTKEIDFYDQTEFSNASRLPDSLKNEVRSILDYLDDFHSFESLSKWFQQDINALLKVARQNDNYINTARAYMHTMGLEYKYYYSNSNTYRRKYTLRAKKQGVVNNVSDVDYIVDVNLGANKRIMGFSLNDSHYRFSLDTTGEGEIFIKNKGQSGMFDIGHEVDSLNTLLLNGKSIFNYETLSKETDILNRRVKFNVDRLQFERKPRIKITSIEGQLLFMSEKKGLEGSN